MRRKPYTERGISRIACARCGASSRFQWQVCADGNQYRGLCVDCDVALNETVMRFMWGTSRDSDLDAYRSKVIR